MNDKLKFFVIALTFSTPVSTYAASISFNQSQPPEGIHTPITVKGAGISGLEQDVKAEGSFQIENDAEGRVINTNISVNNLKNSIPQIPSGSIGWSSEGGGSYTFTISAGGNPGEWDPKQRYCIEVSVDGGQIGRSCTSSKSYWSPTLVHNTSLSQETNISVSFTYE
ncbi:hypothetical protein [Endozoicomonas sp.]|uniref:hypothetical protein n=1 Tax=Endozoicomonas sp. TaxID=1892382 RepID=UPI003AF7F6CC